MTDQLQTQRAAAARPAGLGAGPSGGAVAAVLAGTVAVALGIGAVAYLAGRNTVEQDAKTAFPTPKGKRQRFAALVAQDLYAKLRDHGLRGARAEDVTMHALLDFEPELHAFAREGHSADSVAAYLYNLLIVDGVVKGDRKEAIAHLHGERYQPPPRRTRKTRYRVAA